MPEPPVDVWLITGFLGSGKTTLLRQLTARAEPGEWAVIINEFADLGIDQTLLHRNNDDLVLIDGGCVCCTVQDDLVDALHRLNARRSGGACQRFRRLVIETTGLADPNPIIHTLLNDRRISSKFRLVAVIALVDATHAMDQIDAFTEAASQIAAADCLLISKVDLADPQTVLALQARLSQLNPVADQHCASRGRAGPVNGNAEYPLGFFAGRRAFAALPATTAARHSAGIDSHVIELIDPPDWHEFADWLQALCLARGRDLLRVKGILFVKGEKKPRAINAVNFCIYPSETIDDTDCHAEGVSRLVFIGRNLDTRVLRRTLTAALRTTIGPDSQDGYGLKLLDEPESKSESEKTEP